MRYVNYIQHKNAGRTAFIGFVSFIFSSFKDVNSSLLFYAVIQCSVGKSDMELPSKGKDVCDYAHTITCDYMKRRYVYAHAMDSGLYSDDPRVIQEYADFIIESTDDEASWARTPELYKRAYALCDQLPQSNDPNVVVSCFICFFILTIPSLRR